MAGETRRLRAAGREPVRAGESFGRQVREARERQALSLKAVAERTGLSISMISKIERGLSSPSIRSLFALGNGLSIPLGDLFDERGASFDERSIVVRAGDRKKLDFGERRLVKELLSPQPIGNLELLMIVLAPGGSTGPGSFSHEGEEGGLVLTGALELTVGESVLVLQPGDSFTFASTTAHSYRNVGSIETRVLWVNTPPVY